MRNEARNERIKTPQRQKSMPKTCSLWMRLDDERKWDEFFNRSLHLQPLGIKSSERFLMQWLVCVLSDGLTQNLEEL